jgi:enhancing lycopene biosynthesis protein 2
MATIGVLLSGCGFLDGAEVNEAVLTLLALDRAGVNTVIMAPNMSQLHVVNHLTGQPAVGDTRNVLVESARIARGKIVDLATVKASSLDALVMPGGYGAAKNLCDFAVNGPAASVHPEVARLVRDMHKAGKWICAVCIAPVVVAKVLEQAGVKNAALTLGQDPEFAEKMRAMGVAHVDCPVKEFRVDEANKLISTPAYMFAAKLSEVAEGIERAIATLVGKMRGANP